MRGMTRAWRDRAHSRLGVIRNDVRLLEWLAASNADLAWALAWWRAQARRLAYEAAYLGALCRCPDCQAGYGRWAQVATGRPSAV